MSVAYCRQSVRTGQRSCTFRTCLMRLNFWEKRAEKRILLGCKNEMYVCMMHVCMCVCVCMYVCMCVYVCMYVCMYVCRFQNVVLRCLTPRLHCFLSSHWPSFRFLSFMAFLIPSIQFFFGLPRALFCFGIHFNAILGKNEMKLFKNHKHLINWIQIFKNIYEEQNIVIYTDNKIKQSVRRLCAEGNYKSPILHLPISLWRKRAFWIFYFPWRNFRVLRNTDWEPSV